MILCNRISLPSTKILREKIFGLTGVRYKVTTNCDKAKDIIIRYGNSFPAREGKNVINKPEFIRTVSNKSLFSNLMEKEGVYSPRYYRDTTNLIFPLLIRESLTSSKGRGIHCIKNEDDFNSVWKSNFYWTPFVLTVFELRVHILGGEIVKVFKKIPQEDLGGLPIRNNQVCHFSMMNFTKFPKLNPVVEKLTSVFGDNWFGALDIGWDKKNQQYFLFEINSAPGLNEQTAELYAKYIIDKIKTG